MTQTSPKPTPEEMMQFVVERLSDWEWRINNLYKVVNEAGEAVTFKMRPVQRMIFRSMHNRNCYLKSRQHGITTFIMIFMLDQCLFNENVRCGVIAHGLEEASDLFENKIRYAYDHLPQYVKEMVPAERITGKRLKLKNGSFIKVGTSMRSGTLDFLHVSEFGKICAKFPGRAKEIVTGSFPAVPLDQTIFIESTAEGREGAFYDICQRAEKKQLTAQKLTRRDWKFFFLGWWQDPKNALTDEETKLTIIPHRSVEYFYQIEEEYGIELSDNQKAWYVRTEEDLGSDIKREHPTTSKEAFEETIEGAYFSKQFQKIYKENRIGSFPHVPGVPVETFWDLGRNDYTVIWFAQRVGGRFIFIDFHRDTGHPFSHYLKIVNDLRIEKGYSYSQHTGPHDLEVKDYGGDGRSRKDQAKGFGIDFVMIPRVLDKQVSIDAAREWLDLCSFDETNCKEGIAHLEKYRKEWDEKLGRWKDNPRHDECSDTSDAYQQGAMAQPFFKRILERRNVNNRSRTR